MPHLATGLGLRVAEAASTVPNYAPAYLGFHFVFAYVICVCLSFNFVSHPVLWIVAYPAID